MRHKGEGMKTYDVTITETLSRTVSVKAKNLKEAEYKIETEHHSEKYILDADDFAGVTFKAQKRSLTG